MKNIISAKDAPAAIGPYSHGVEANGLLFTSGQIPLVPETGKLVSDTIEEQASQVFKNLGAILAASGMGFANVIKTTCFVTDLKNFAKVNAVYAEIFPENPPARSCVQVSALPGGALLEIEVVAAR